MNFTVESSRQFIQQSATFIRRHPDFEPRLASLIEDLRQDPFQPKLRLHHLPGELNGLYAVRLSFAYRVTLTLVLNDRTITLLDIGTHNEVHR